AMLEAEAAGLRELAAAQALRVPQVLAIGCAEQSAFLALEWIESGAAGRGAEHRLGERLAAQHRVTARAFGWHRDNTIGRTPQLNGWLSDWVEFVRERRLRPQLALAARNGFRDLLEAVGERPQGPIRASSSTTSITSSTTPTCSAAATLARHGR